MTAPAGKNSVPLEKVILSMDLSKGVDERSRPEVGGDQSKLITTLENLVQDQTGAWVMRPGLTRMNIATTEELYGTTIGGLRKMMKTRDGISAIGLVSALYQFHEQTQSFRTKGYVPSLSATGIRITSAPGIGGSGFYDLGRVICSAFSDKFIVVAYESYKRWVAAADYSANPVLVVYDRGSGSTIARYPLAVPASATVGTTPTVGMVFCSDAGGANPGRYLHVYLRRQGANVQFAEIDLGISYIWPESGQLAMSSTGINPAGAGPGVFDVTSYQDWSIVALGASGGYSSRVGGAVLTLAGDWRSVSVDANGLAWFVGLDTGGTGRLKVRAVTATNITAAATYAWVDPAWTPAVWTTMTDGQLRATCTSTGALHIFNITNLAFSTGVTYPFIYYFKTSAPTDTSATQVGWITGWMPLGQPFCDFNTNRCFIPLQKGYPSNASATTAAIQPIVVADATSITVQYRADAAGDQAQFQVPPCALLDDEGSWNNATSPFTHACRVHSRSTLGNYGANHLEFCAVTSRTTNIRGGGVCAHILKAYHLQTSKDNHDCLTDSANVISGATTFYYDGYHASEMGFVDFPIMAADKAAGAITGSYNYVAVFKWFDSKGNVAYSRTSDVLSVTYAAELGNISISAPCVTDKERTFGLRDHQTTVELYRTLNGGTQYYFIASYSGAGTTNILAAAGGYFKFQDNTLDASISSNPLFYRQPGTPGTALDRFPPPASIVACSHKDRVFLVDHFGDKVHYSSFTVNGEVPWFNPTMVIQPYGGTGPITALASMDGRLFIFKKDAIWVVDGDGPPENGGTGTEFSPPARLSIEYGCVDWRSMVVTPNGIFYRSQRGIELLSRSLQLSWIGDRVQNTVNAYKTTTGAAIDRDSRVRFFLSSAADEVSEAADTGIEVVYDSSNDCWSTSKYWTINSSGAAVYASAIKSVCMYDAPNGVRYVVVATRNSNTPYVYKLDDTQPSDGTNPFYIGNIPWKFETGWIRPTGPIGRFRFHDAYFLGKRVGVHDLKLSLAFDYEDYSQSRTWKDASTKETLEELNLQPKLSQPVTFRLKAEQSQANDPGQRGVDILNVSFVVSPKAGIHQVAEYKKG